MKTISSIQLEVQDYRPGRWHAWINTYEDGRIECVNYELTPAQAERFSRIQRHYHQLWANGKKVEVMR
jgi:hypothetical protein